MQAREEEATSFFTQNQELWLEWKLLILKALSSSKDVDTVGRHVEKILFAPASTILISPYQQIESSLNMVRFDFLIRSSLGKYPNPDSSGSSCPSPSGNGD